jgi:hypothetical protein
MSLDETFSAEHKAAQEALPWMANATLDAGEEERLRAHLRSCARCRDELALLQAVRAAGPGPGSGPAPGCDPDRAWARMQQRLDQPQTAAMPGILARWRARIAANDRSWLRGAVALQCCLIAVLAALLVRPDQGRDAAMAYRGLGASAPVQAGILVVFRPDTPERELRRIVRASGAHLAGGPTAADAWLLDGGNTAAVLARLRAEPAVELAEPLGTGARP